MRSLRLISVILLIRFGQKYNHNPSKWAFGTFAGILALVWEKVTNLHIILRSKAFYGHHQQIKRVLKLHEEAHSFLYFADVLNYQSVSLFAGH